MKHLLISVFAVFTALLTVLSFTGCKQNNGQSFPITVSGTPIPDEIFRYYLDEAFANNTLTKQEERINYATEQCIRYVAINSAFAQRGYRLSPATRAQISSEANTLWKLFEAHYTQIGVSKETYIKIRTSVGYTEQIRTSLYGTNGSMEISEEVLKEYFHQNYGAFKLIRGYLFTYDVYGNIKDYTGEELEAIQARYDEAAENVNAGNSIDLVYASIASAGDQDVQQALKTELIQKDDAYYPEGFYEKVMETEENKASVCVFGDYIYLIYRCSTSDNDDLFQAHRDECLKAVSEEPLQKEIKQICLGYTSVRHTDLVQVDYEEMERIINHDE